MLEIERDVRLCRINIGVGSVYVPCDAPVVAIMRFKSDPSLPQVSGPVCLGHREVREASGLYELVEEL